MDQANRVDVALVYADDHHDCYQVTGNLVAWVGVRLPFVLLARDVEPTKEGFAAAARGDGLVLDSFEFVRLAEMAEDLTLHRAFQAALTARQEMELSASVKLTFTQRPNYGLFITFKAGDRWASIGQRRFKRLLELIGVEYRDGQSPADKIPGLLV